MSNKRETGDGDFNPLAITPNGSLTQCWWPFYTGSTTTPSDANNSPTRNGSGPEDSTPPQPPPLLAVSTGPGRRAPQPPPQDSVRAMLRDMFGVNDDDEPPDEQDGRITFASCGGLDDQINYMRRHILFYLANKEELYEDWGVEPVKGIIFHGPPGSGKTLLAKALANELTTTDGRPFSFFQKNGTEMFGKYVGQTEGAIRKLFQMAKQKAPSIIFLDEMDGLCGIREDSGPNSKFYNGVVTQLLGCMDQVERGQVLVIGATNRLDSIDPAFVRPGRFDKALGFHLPEAPARVKILKIHTQKWVRKPSEADYEEVASRTVGYTGADLEHLAREALMAAIDRLFPDSDYGEADLSDLNVSMHDWRVAISQGCKSNSNVFGNSNWTGEQVNSDIRLLTAGIEGELKACLDPLLNGIRAEANSLTGVTSVCAWSNNARSVQAFDFYVVPAFVSGLHHSTPAFKLELYDISSEKRITTFMGKVMKPKKTRLLFIPQVDRLAARAESLHLLPVLMNELIRIRGTPVLLLATASIPVSDLNEELQELFPAKLALKIRGVMAAEAKSFLSYTFSSEFFETRQRTIHSQRFPGQRVSDFRTPLTDVEKKEKADFENNLKCLLNHAVEMTTGEEITDVLDLKSNLNRATNDTLCSNEHLDKIREVLRNYPVSKCGNHGPPPGMYR